MALPSTSADNLELRLIAAPFTPFTAAEEIDLASVPLQAERLRADGVHGAFVAGTTGESASLSVSERKALLEAWSLARGPLQLFSHVGSSSVGDAVELAQHAAGLGVDAIAAVPPYYFKPDTVAELIRMLQPIAAAAPRTPFFYYHIPRMTGVGLPMTPFVRQAAAAIPNFAGVKFTHSDLIEFADCVDAAGAGVEMMFGRDPLLAQAALAGARTAVGSTFNFAARLYLDMFTALRAGEWRTVREQQRLSREIVAVTNRHGGLVAQKALYSLLVVESGPARPPFARLSDAAIDELTRFAVRSGLAEGSRIERTGGRME